MQIPPHEPNARLLALARAVEKLHGLEVEFVGSSRVHERYGNKTVWAGTVTEFELTGHPTAKTCYAWSVPVTNDAPERFYAVLHAAEVNSPEKAVRASIVADHRKNNA